MSYSTAYGLPSRHGQGTFSTVSVPDEDGRTEQAVNLRGRNVQPQVFTNQPTILHQQTAFATNTYPRPDNLRQNVGDRSQPTYTISHQQTSPLRQNISGGQPQPTPIVIQKQSTSGYRQTVGDRDIGPRGIFSFIGSILATICLLAFCILLSPM